MPHFGNKMVFSIIALSILLLASCASKQASVQTLYSSEKSIESYENILVVSVGKERTHRAKMERTIVREIASNERKASGSVDMLAANVALNKDTVTKVVLNNKIDGVLVINLLESSVKVEIDEKRTETIIERPRPEKLIDVFVQRYKEVDIAREMRVNATVTIVADLYSGVNGEKIWSAQTTVYEGNDADPIIEEAAKSIVKQLVKDKVI